MKNATKKILAPVFAGLMALSIVASSIQPVEAGSRGRGIAIGAGLGLLGLGLLSAHSHAGPRYYSRHDDYDDGGEECYRGEEQCRWYNRHCFENRYGEYVCRGGVYRCNRPLICE
jgi:hypothetical protein